MSLNMKCVWELRRLTNDTTKSDNPIFHVLQKGISIAGRTADCEIKCMTCNAVSRKHFRIHLMDDGSIFIRDLKSLNGTFLGDEKVIANRDISLQHGDVIGMGAHLNNREDENFVFQLYQRILKEDDPCIEDGNKCVVPLKTSVTTNKTSKTKEENIATNLDCIPSTSECKTRNIPPSSQSRVIEIINLDCSDSEDEILEAAGNEKMKEDATNDQVVISTSEQMSPPPLSSDEEASTEDSLSNADLCINKDKVEGTNPSRKLNLLEIENKPENELQKLNFDALESPVIDLTFTCEMDKTSDKNTNNISPNSISKDVLPRDQVGHDVTSNSNLSNSNECTKGNIEVINETHNSNEELALPENSSPIMSSPIGHLIDEMIKTAVNDAEVVHPFSNKNTDDSNKKIPDNIGEDSNKLENRFENSVEDSSFIKDCEKTKEEMDKTSERKSKPTSEVDEVVKDILKRRLSSKLSESNAYLCYDNTGADGDESMEDKMHHTQTTNDDIIIIDDDDELPCSQIFDFKDEPGIVYSPIEAHEDLGDGNDEDEEPDEASDTDSVDEWFQKLSQSQFDDNCDDDLENDNCVEKDNDDRNTDNCHTIMSSDDMNELNKDLGLCRKQETEVNDVSSIKSDNIPIDEHKITDISKNSLNEKNLSKQTLKKKSVSVKRRHSESSLGDHKNKSSKKTDDVFLETDSQLNEKIFRKHPSGSKRKLQDSSEEDEGIEPMHTITNLKRHDINTNDFNKTKIQDTKTNKKRVKTSSDSEYILGKKSKSKPKNKDLKCKNRQERKLSLESNSETSTTKKHVNNVTDEKTTESNDLLPHWATIKHTVLKEIDEKANSFINTDIQKQYRCELVNSTRVENGLQIDNKRPQSVFCDDIEALIEINTIKKVQNSEVSAKCTDLPHVISESTATVKASDQLIEKKTDLMIEITSKTATASSTMPDKLGIVSKKIGASKKRKPVQIVDAKALPVKKKQWIHRPETEQNVKDKISAKCNKADYKAIRKEKLKFLSESKKDKVIVGEKLKPQNTAKTTTKVTNKSRNEMFLDTLVSKISTPNDNNQTSVKGYKESKTSKLSSFKIPRLSSKVVNSTSIDDSSKTSEIATVPSEATNHPPKLNRAPTKPTQLANIPETSSSTNDNNGYLVDQILSSTMSNSTHKNTEKRISRVTQRAVGGIENEEPVLMKPLPDNWEFPVNDTSCLKPILKLVPEEKKEKSNTNKVKFNFPGDSVSCVYGKIYDFEIEEGAILKPVSKQSTAKVDLPPPRRKPDVATAISTSYFDETIHCICNWNCAWFSEKSRCKGEPCGIYSGQLYHLKNDFVSYADYRRGMYPLMLYQLWQSICKQHDVIQHKNKPYRIEIKHSSEKEVKNKFIIPQKENEKRELTRLECQVLLDDKDQINAPRQGDLVVLDVTFVDKEGIVTDPRQLKQRILAYIYTSNRGSISSHRDVSVHLKNKNPKASHIMDCSMYIKKKKLDIDRRAETRLAVIKNINSDLRQFNALDQLSSSPLLSIICDPMKNIQPLPTVDLQQNLLAPIMQERLNPSQKKAVLIVAKACSTQSNSLHLIHGPPGCGKSEVIMGIILQMWFDKRNNPLRILLCAPSNAAIDDIFLRLMHFRQNCLINVSKYNMVRIGRSENKSISNLTLDTIVQNELKNQMSKLNDEEEKLVQLSHLEAKKNQLTYQIENLGKKKNDFRYIHTLETKLADTIKAIKELECGNTKKVFELKEQREKKRHMELRVLENAHIIVTTLSSCFNSQMEMAQMQRKLKWTCCIVDEATQCIEPDNLIPLLLGVNNLVLVGDPHQLPATVLSETAKQHGLARSLFARHQDWWHRQRRDITNDHYHFLNTQYRMHPAIAQWPSEYFYKKEVISHESLESRSANFPLQPYLVLSHEHTQSFQEECNYSEAKMVGNLVHKILESELVDPKTTIGVITPYNRQRDQIKKCIGFNEYVEVGSVDSYQGRERDIIIFSCVRTEGIGFMSDMERLNVALTRARHSLIIVGNFKSLQKDETWALLLNNAKSRNLYRNVVHSHQDLFQIILKPEWAERAS